MPWATLASLRVRLLLLVLLAVVPALALMFHTAREQRRAATEDIRQDALRLARSVARDQAMVMENAHQVLAALARLPPVQGSDPEACGKLLGAVVDGFPRYINLSVFLPDGEMLCTGKPYPPGVSTHLPSSLRETFYRAIATGALASSDFAIGRVTGRPVIRLAYPVIKPGGTIHGAVFTSLDLHWLNELSAEAALPPGSTLTMVDHRGTVLVRSPGPEPRLGKRLPEEALLRAFRTGRGEGTLTLRGADGEPRLHAFTPIYSAAGEPSAYVSVGIPIRTAYAHADRALRRNLLLLGLLAGLALAAAWIGGNLFIVRRVKALLAATRRLEAGDLAARTGLRDQAGEMGELARAFDAMAGALQRRAEEAARAQATIREREEQLRHAQKMEAVGRLGGGIAHDFNNLLMAIRGNTELALLEVEDATPVREELQEILHATDRAAVLTRQLLAFSRKQVLEPVTVDLNAVVSGTERMLRRLIREDVELVTVLEPHLGKVRADPGQIEQVLVNLVVNARDAMPQGGRLVIRTANAGPDEDHVRRFARAEPGEYVTFSVSDTGTGIDTAILERIWEPFFTTKEQGKGTGLGLSTVYGIVKQSGGYVWVESEPGRGSTFRVSLPRVDAEAVREAEPVEPVAARGGTETILLAEDEAPVRALASRALRAAGYHVLEAEDGETALRLCWRHAGTIDLLVTDVVMPGMGGPELARRVAELRPDARVLYISGYSDEALHAHGITDPAPARLQKPFSLGALAGRVRAVLDAPPATRPTGSRQAS